MTTYTLNLIQYITLIALSISAGYILHGIIRAIKDGTFFDWEQIKKLGNKYLTYKQSFWTGNMKNLAYWKG